MFLKYIFFGTLIAFICIEAMEEKILYQFERATNEDVAEILDIINAKAIHDNDKVVIVPEKFREIALRAAIEKQRLFVAKHNAKIIGLQKLFVIEDSIELEEVLSQEIRCQDQKTCAAGRLTFAENLGYSVPYLICHNFANTRIHYENNDTYIYSGGAFTDPDYRGKGVNTDLSDFAFSEISDAVLKHCEAYQSKNLIMLHGLVAQNAGKPHDLIGGRSYLRAIQFNNFVKKLNHPVQELFLYRYPARMPQFDPKSEECVPLHHDKQELCDLGCVISYHINNNHEEK